MTSMDRTQVEQIIKEYLDKNQMSSRSAFQAPFHRHNGSDSPKIIMGDLALDNRGLVFPTNENSVVFNVNNQGFPVSSILTIRPQVYGTQFLEISNFKRIFSTATERNVVSVITDPITGYPASSMECNSFYTKTVAANSASDYAEYVYGPDGMGVVRSGPSWYMHFPDNASLPASPVPGDVCYYNNHLQVCQAAGVWTQI